MRPDLDDIGIRRYLLGLLPEPEAEALEQEYLARPEVLEQVRSVEHDLLDDYAAGRLGPEEKVAFEGRYLASQPLRNRVLAARALRLASPVPKAPAARVLTRRSTRWTGPLAIAAALLVAALAFWLWPSRAPLMPGSPAPTSVARSETPMPEQRVTPSPATMLTPYVTQRAPATTRLVFALSPGLLRGQGEPAELRIPPGTGTVVLELEGDPDILPPAGTPLTVIIATVEGKRVWGGTTRRVANPSRPSLLASIQLPPQILMAGDYLVTLSAGATDGQIVHRYFVRAPVR